MQEIKAFVAHSFSSADKGLIDTFIGHFRNLERVLPHFSWDHAQEAEPVPVPGKVLAKIEDKNVFIAICTRTERVVPEGALSKIPFFGVTTVNERQLEWKTSDWIIQEIGLAVGRKMSVIVFLENDLRKPGGLIGEIEYIPFLRTDMFPAFEKLLQMLGSLKPKALVVEKIAETAAAPKEEEKKVGGLLDNEEPALDWDQDKYDLALFRAVFRRQEELLKKIDVAYRATPLAQDESLTVWEGRIEFLRMLNHQTFDLEKLKQLSKSHPSNALLLFYLARGFQEFEEHQIAAETYEQAAANAANKEATVRYRDGAVEAYARAGMIPKAREIAEKMRNDAAEEPALKYDVLSALRDFAELEKDNDLRLAIMEQMVELRPSDVSMRFSLAYEHSQCRNSDMALFHYLKIPPSHRTSTTWNNLGVSFSEIGMAVRAVGAWRTSARENDTLAKSNLGFKLLGAGFWDEAKKECNEALEIKDYVKNVPELLKRLNDVSDEETKKLEVALEKVKAKAAFYRKLGEAALKPTPTEIAKEWNSSFGKIQAKVDGDMVRIEGAQERTEFAGLLSQIGVPGLVPEKKVMHRIEYVGRLRGNAILGEVKRSRDGEKPSLLAEGLGNPNVVMFFNADHTELSVMENPQSLAPTFYDITRERTS